MKAKYVIFMSAALSWLSLPANNVNAESVSNEENENVENVSLDDNKDSSKVDQSEYNYSSDFTAVSNGISNTEVDNNQSNNALESNDSEINHSETDSFDNMRQSWNDVVAGNKYYDQNDISMNQISNQQDTKVKNTWNDMIKDDNKDDLWKSGATLTSSANLTTNYRNLESMAIATTNPGSQFYNNKEMINDVINGLNWMNENKYNSSIKTYGNWWDWEIGAPRAINDIVSIMYPYLTKEQIKRNMDAIDFFVPNPNTFRSSVDPKLVLEATGANQVDISKVKIIQSILKKDDVGLINATKALEKIFPLVDTGEGFYKDGSFIQHDNVGYNGSYGNVLLDGTSQLLSVIQNTPYSVKDESMSAVKFWIDKGFAPFIYKGNLMDMVRGRAISRGTSQSNIAADELIRGIVRVSDTFPEQDKIYYQSLVKQWLNFGDNYNNYIKAATNYRDIALIANIMSNPQLDNPVIRDTELLNYATMDKVIFKNNKKNYAIALSMSSSRTKRYEAMNNENIHGWYTGDGMMYVYNDDLNQYNDNYWSTVDPYKLAGTTETTSEQKDGSGSTTSSSDYAGGSYINNLGELGDFGSFGMDFINNDSDLSARKSWFITDDGVISLGSAVNNMSKSDAITVIENRKLSPKTKYNIYVNGELMNLKLNDTMTLDNVSSIYLQAEEPGESMGYKFITPQTLNLGLIERTGAWKDINKAQSENQSSRTYLEIYKEHSEKNNGYNFVTYPGVSKSEFRGMFNPIILKNNSNVQAVKYNNFEGINVFNDTEETVDNMIFDEPVSVIKVNNGNQILFGVADPKQNKAKDLTFRIKDAGYTVLESNPTIKVELINGEWLVTLSKQNRDGQTHFISMVKE